MQRLRISINSDKINALATGSDHALNGGTTAATGSDDLNAGECLNFGQYFGHTVSTPYHNLLSAKTEHGTLLGLFALAVFGPGELTQYAGSVAKALLLCNYFVHFNFIILPVHILCSKSGADGSEFGAADDS